MADTVSKPWYLSKGVWAGVVAVLIATYNALSANFGLPVIPDWVFGMLDATGIYSRVTATTVIK